MSNDPIIDILFHAASIMRDHARSAAHDGFGTVAAANEKARAIEALAIKLQSHVLVPRDKA